MFKRARKLVRRLIVLELLSALAVLIWWWWQQSEEESAAEAVGSTEAPPTPPAPPDDLRRIEGIGPKIAGALQAAGVQTFAQVAASGVDELERIVKAAGVRIAYPQTWPEQAQLAAVGDWDGLAALQGQLKGGRRVA
ncbi:MAG: hypothetical protein JXD18_03165 [Anaerolineae bacterium]|nr:hypothetical protein [Anaerolineae bacterium]